MYFVLLLNFELANIKQKFANDKQYLTADVSTNHFGAMKL